MQSVLKSTNDQVVDQALSAGTATAEGRTPVLTEWVNEVASEWVQRRSSNNRRAFMKTTLLLITLAVFTCFTAYSPVSAEPTGSSTMAGGNTPSPDNVPKDKRTDLTGGQSGVPDEYATTPVRQGKLKEVTDSKWLNQEVTNAQGEKLGKVTKVLKDEKTQDIEYVMLQVADNHTARPIQWHKFQQKGDKLMLNATKDQLQPSVSQDDVKDMSPDLAMFMDEIEQARSEPKGSGGHEKPAGDPGTLSGAATLGEDTVGSHRAAPPTPAPGFENEAQKGKK
jgi:sporulation protein YlmC with PRC-barrel domain